MELDENTRLAIDHLRRHGTRFKRDFYSETGPYQKKIQAIKQLRDEFLPLGGFQNGQTHLGLREAKDAVEAWEAGGCRTFMMSAPEAKILLKNLLLRFQLANGGSLKNLPGMTEMEVEAIRRMAE